MKILKLSRLFCATLLLSGCGVMPGMQNLDISQMDQRADTRATLIRPTLIPITSDLMAERDIVNYIYRVSPADVLDISVWQHPEFNPMEIRPNNVTPSAQGAAGQAGYLVNHEGKIYFPLIGYVSVAGKTVDGIRATITTRLSRYIKNPQINVRVADFRGQKIYVLGEVMKPGFIPLNDQPLTITDALTMSGSIDPNAADPGHVYIIRGNFAEPKVYWLNAKRPHALLLAEHFNLQPGDVLYVSSAAATRWNRIMAQLLPTLQAAWYTKTTTNLR